MFCDLCGKETDKLYKITLEGSVLYVCEDCKKYGKVIGFSNEKELNQRLKKVKQLKAKKVTPEPETIETVVDNYGTLIKSAREKRNIPPKDLARLIGIKESLLLKIERSDYEPPIKLAKEFEKALSIKLIQTQKLKNSITTSDDLGGDATIGDLIKIKRRKSQK